MFRLLFLFFSYALPLSAQWPYLETPTSTCPPSSPGDPLHEPSIDQLTVEYGPEYYTNWGDSDIIRQHHLTDATWSRYTVDSTNLSSDILTILGFANLSPNHRGAYLEDFDQSNDFGRSYFLYHNGVSFSWVDVAPTGNGFLDSNLIGITETSFGAFIYPDGPGDSYFAYVSNGVLAAEFPPANTADSNWVKRDNGSIVCLGHHYNESTDTSMPPVLLQRVGSSWTTELLPAFPTLPGTALSYGDFYDRFFLREDAAGNLVVFRSFRSSNLTSVVRSVYDGTWSHETLNLNAPGDTVIHTEDHSLYYSDTVLTHVNVDGSFFTTEFSTALGPAAEVCFVDAISTTATGIAYESGGDLRYAIVTDGQVTTELVVPDSRYYQCEGLDHDENGRPFLFYWGDVLNFEIYFSIATPTFLSLPDRSVVEDSTGVFDIELLIDLSLTASFDVTVQSGSALVGSDLPAFSDTITIPAGQTSGTITIPITNDGDPEGPEMFTVTLSNPVNIDLPSDPTFSVTIIDDDTAGLSIGDLVVDESSGTAMVPVSLSPAAAGTVMVDFATSAFSASSPQDYMEVSQTLTFNAGDTLKLIPVVIEDDHHLEGSEIFEVILSNPVNSSIFDGLAEILITDNELMTASSPSSGAQFGSSLSAPDDLPLTGVIGGNGGKGSAAFGAMLENTLIPADLASNDEFGFAVAHNSSYLVVGSRNDDDSGSNSGSVYVYDRANLTTAPYKVNGSTAGTGSRFGGAIALDENHLLVGAHRDNENGSQSGAAYYFNLTSTSATELDVVLPSDGAASDQFGRSLALDYPFALVGATLDDDAGANSGSAYLFNLATDIQIAKLTAPDGAAGHSFGRACALSPPFAFVGASDHSAGGAVYVFDINTGNHLITIYPASPEEESFGFALAANDHFLLVGVPGDDTVVSNDGSAILFDLHTLQRIKTLRHVVPNAGQATGRSVALGDNCAFAGAPYSDDLSDSMNVIADAGSIIADALPAPVPLPRIISNSFDSNANIFSVVFVGMPGVDYVEERSDTLQSWFGSGTFTASGLPQSRDFSATIPLPFIQFREAP